MASSSAAAAAIIKDHGSAVGQYFGSIRIPAAFLLGSSFAGVFAVKPPAKMEDMAPIDNKFRIAYTLCLGTSFLLATNTVVIATAALTRNLKGGFDTTADSGYTLLTREFHFEFVITRWTFLVGLFSFLIGVANRVLFEFKLFSTMEPPTLRERRKEMGIALCLLMSSLLFHLISYINGTLYCWNNLWEMTIDLVKVMIQRGSITRPLEPLSLVLAISGITFVVHALTMVK